MAVPAQAGCTIWRALTHQSDEHLRDVVVQFSDGGGFELAHLGVVDAIRGAEICELSTAYAEFELECDWPNESEAEASERLEAMRAEAETCLASTFDSSPDREYGDGDSAFLHQYDLDIEYEEELEVDVQLEVRRYRQSYRMVLQVRREAW